MPLPDLSEPAVSARFRIGEQGFQVAVSPLLPDPDREPNTDVVQLMVTCDGRPLTLCDLGAPIGQCATLWSYLCSKLTEVVVDFYDPQPRPDGDLNPRLGCWGSRPDFKASGRDDDCSLAVVVGISIWQTGARPRGGPEDFLREVGQTLAEVVAYWVVSIERARRGA